MTTLVINRTYIVRGEDREEAMQEWKECENDMDYFHQEEWVAIEDSINPKAYEIAMELLTDEQLEEYREKCETYEDRKISEGEIEAEIRS